MMTQIDKFGEWLAQHALILFVILCFLVFVPTWLCQYSVSAGWWWDIANGLGYLGVVNLLFLGTKVTFLQGFSRREALSRKQLRAATRLPMSRHAQSIRYHEYLAWFGLSLVLLHVILFLLNDAIVYEYLSLDGPNYMLAGYAGFLLLGLSVLTSLPRVRQILWRKYEIFKKFHWWIYIGVVALCGWHILGSGFYLMDNVQAVSFAGVILIVPFLLRHLVPTLTDTISISAFVGVQLLLLAIFVLLRHV